MPRRHHRPSAGPLAAIGCLVLGLGACADHFTVTVPESGPVLAGTIDAAAPAPAPGVDCGGMRVAVGIDYDPATQIYPGGGQLPVGYIAGRAYRGDAEHLNPLERVVPGAQPFWLEGDIFENGTVLMTLYQSTIVPSGPAHAPGAKPFSVFRGTLVGNRLDVVEQPPSCGRRLVADAESAVAQAPDAP